MRRKEISLCFPSGMGMGKADLADKPPEEMNFALKIRPQREIDSDYRGYVELSFPVIDGPGGVKGRGAYLSLTIEEARCLAEDLNHFADRAADLYLFE